MRIKYFLTLLIIGFAFSAPMITIQQFGNIRIATSPSFPVPLIMSAPSVPSGQMNIMAESAETVFEEADAPVELHQLAGVKVDASASSIHLDQSSAPTIIIAVLDSGIDLNNPQLQPYLYVNNNEIPGNGVDDDHNGFIDDVNGLNLYTLDGNVQDDLGHGTLISSIIAEASKGHVKILPIKIFDAQGKSSQFLVASALQYAKQMGASVANCSFGYDYSTEVLKLEVGTVQANGLVLVASAGNQGLEKAVYPAAFPDVIAVASLDGSDHLANFSNYGSFLSVSCMGVDVAGLYPGNQTAKGSGTSISAGYISGLMGLMYSSAQKQPSRANMQQYIVDIRDPLGIGANLVGWDKYSGDGKLDVASFTSPLTATTNSSLILGPVLSYPNPISNYNPAQIGYNLNQAANVAIRVYDMFGTLRWSQDIAAGSIGAQAAYNKVSFDGKDTFGNWLSNDTYLVLVSADDNGYKVVKRHRLTIIR